MTPTQQRPVRRVRASAGSLLRIATVAALLVPALVGIGASSADAAAYRYWSFWVTDGSGPWTYSNVGAASTRPDDGDVQGWRFAVSAGASSSTIAPRTAGSFDALCAGQSQVADKKRVGLVVDFGTRSDAPPGETPPTVRTFCVLAPVKASGAAVLQLALSVRSEGGLVCGINGYPRSECAVVVEASKPAATPTRRPSTAPRPSAATSAAPGSSSAAKPTASADAADSLARAQATTPKPRQGADDSLSPDPQSPGAEGSNPTSSITPTVISDAAPAAASGSTGSPWGALIAVVLLGLAAGSAFILRRRAS